jgi:hypothetical protein
VGVHLPSITTNRSNLMCSVYAPISLFSLVLGSSHLTIELLARLEISEKTTSVARVDLSFVGASWSRRRSKYVVDQPQLRGSGVRARGIPLGIGLALIATPWAPLLV